MSEYEPKLKTIRSRGRNIQSRSSVMCVVSWLRSRDAL